MSVVCGGGGGGGGCRFVCPFIRRVFIHVSFTCVMMTCRSVGDPLQCLGSRRSRRERATKPQTKTPKNRRRE